MTLSLAVSANAAFKDDKSISDDYAESVAVLNGMGVFKGYEDGSFKPEGNITRAEVATIIYRIYTADVAKNDKSGLYATYNKFSDMAGAGWAQGYIGYCANASLVKGYPDGTFKPSGKVTGYEVLAMILRAVGYDKNNEFSGADWALHVAQTAQQLGVLKNIKGVDLNAAASRELVAELLFRAIAEASTVNYTPAFGYVTDKVLKLDESTLGYKNFKLVGKADADSFGRPATKWTYNVGDKSTLVVAKADASYTTKVDECDIAKDLGITSAKPIEGAYIDGVSYAKNLTSADVTSNRYATINPLATTSYVGAQGRLFEVYKDAKTIVMIDTFLAKGTKVTAASTDRNGHVTDATVDLKVYQVNDTGIDEAGVEAEGFTVGQYVLVTMTVDTASPVVQTVEAATVTPMGQLKNWSYAYGTTAATTTLADTKYNDADKFYVGNVKGIAYTATAWDSIVDSYGNLIGMVASSVNYVVVGKISWKHDNSTVAGGKALADLVLADGTKVAGATIASVDNAVTTNYNSGVVEVLTAEVADDYTNNNAYYNRIFTYSVNADGSYDLVKYCDATNVNSHNTGAVTITKGKTSTIAGFTNTVVANTDTMFLVMDKDSNGNYTYYKNCCCKLTIRLYR
ncbi:MAG: S-layer homology domain-containing protein [Oscillospiraceae bacterium]|nr:S-layer homology domain-containing protein [Oscillospiraceae bacterium]